MSAVASVALHLRRGGYKIRLVTGTGTDLDATEHDGEGALLDSLADVNVSAAQDITSLVERIRRRGDGGLIIAVLGALSLEEAQALGALRASGTTCLAMFIDPTTWLNLSDEVRAATEADHAGRHDGPAAVGLAGGQRGPRGEPGRALAAGCPRLPGLHLPGRHGGERHKLRRNRTDGEECHRMSQRHPLALVAGAATILASFPLATVFANLTWFFYVVIAVAIVVGTAILSRTLRAPVSLQVLAMMAALLLYLTFTFPSGGEIIRLIPTGSTFVHFNNLFVAAGGDIRSQTVPVGDSDGLLLLTTAGVGLMAMLVDLAAVGVRRPALAGLPMLAIYSVPVAVLPDGLSVLPFGFAAAGFLWLLVADSVDRVRRFGRRFTGDGRDVDVWEPSPLSSAGRRLGVAGLAIAIVLPLAVPGMTSGLIDRFGNGFGDPGGPGDANGPPGASVNLDVLLRDNLNRTDPFDMVRVTTTDPSPFYLRFATSDQITKDGFANRAPFAGTAVTRGILDLVALEIPGVTQHRYSAQVEALNFSMPLAPIYERLAATEGLDAQWLYDSSTSQLYTRRPGATINSKHYSFEFVRTTYTPAALRTAGSIAPQDSARELTALPSIPFVTNLVSKLTDGKVTEYDKVRAIYDYFSPTSGFQYTLSTTEGDSGSAIVDFLTKKRGFCVQYAGAMAWLVRAAGFPSRVAFGFTRGSGASGGVYTLTNYNLHAWTEVFFPNFGWVPFDATPPAAVTGSVQSAWAPDAADPGNALAPVGPEDFGRPTGPPVSISAAPPTDPGQNQGAGPAATPVNNWLVGAAAAVVVILFLLFAPAWRRRALRRRRRAHSGPVIVMHRDGTSEPGLAGIDLVTEPAAAAAARADAHQAWAELLDTMIDFAVPVDESETPRATGGRLATLLATGAAGPAELLAQAEERARYAKAPLRSDGLDTALAATRSAILARATRRERLRAALLPRSVLQRWRAGWLTWLGGMIGRAGRIREATAAANPRRLLARNRTA